MDSETVIPICASVLSILLLTIARRKRLKYRRNKRVWMRPSLRRRLQPGLGIKDRLDAYREDDLTCDLRLQSSFMCFVRMCSSDFEKLIQLVSPLLSKPVSRGNNFRPRLSVLDKLCMTLRYLASGNNYRSLQLSYDIHHTTLCGFVPEVCDAISKALEDLNMIRVSNMYIIYKCLRTSLL